MTQTNNQTGVIVVYALLVISLITAIAITVSIIIINELRITTTATDATLAYYAAEAGIERGLHAVKIKRNEPGITLSQAIIDIKALQASLDNDTEYDNDLSEFQTSEIKNEELRENQYIQADYYNVDNPLQPSGVVSIKVENTGNNPASWAEISWAAWDNAGTLGSAENALRVIGPTDLQGGWPINLNVFSSLPLAENPIDPVGYRVRIKALFGDLSNLSVTPYDGSGGEVDNLPSQVEIKAVGTKGKLKQSLTALVPWEIPLHGLYDYVLFSEEGLAKTIIVSREIYTSGAIQVENSLFGDCTGCPHPFYNTCPDWQAVCCAEQSICTVGTSGGVCAINDTEVSGVKVSDHWVLPIPDYVPAADEYYLSMRAKYTGGEVEITLGDTCKVVPDQASGEWFSCTITNPDFSTLPNTNLQFKHLGSGSIDIDWYQLSSYKIFEDCSNITSCTAPAPDCGNCICEEGENCDFDVIDCTTEIVCKVPACTNGCQEENMHDVDDVPGCMGGSRCCSGICEPMDPPSYCDSDAECADADVCTTDSCTASGTCSSQCSNIEIITCGDSDGCCSIPGGCTNVPGPNYDPDCVGPPDKEYLRHMAYDENSVDLTGLYSGAGVSMRPVPAWEQQHYVDLAPDLRGVWAADANNVWAVGNYDLSTDAVIYYYDGNSWTEQTSGVTFDLRSVFGLNSSTIWAVGANGTVVYYNGSNWTAIPPFTTTRLNGVWASGVNNVWVVADEIDTGDGIVWYCDSNCTSTDGSANWIQQRVIGLNQHLNGIWGLDSNNIWAAGDDGKIVYYTGGSWSEQASGTSNILYAISGVDSNNIWAVGVGGKITYSNNGTNWNVDSLSPILSTLYSVTAYNEYGSARAVIGAQSGYTVYHDGSNGGGSVAAIHGRIIRGLFALDQDNIWAVGGYEGIFKAHLPAGSHRVGIGSDQYWFSREFSALDVVSGQFSANLNITRLPSSGKAEFQMEMGYCVACNDYSNPSDFTSLYTSPVLSLRFNSNQYLVHNMYDGAVNCENCRLYYRIWHVDDMDFDISISGRDFDATEDRFKNSYIEIPGP